MSSAAPATRQAGPEEPPVAATTAGRGLLLPGVALALVALVLGAAAIGGDGPASGTAGLTTAGPVVEGGLLVVTLAGRIAAVGTIGALVLAAVLVPGRSGSLAPAARRAVLATSRWAAAWAGATVAGAVLTLSRLVGAPPTELTWSSARVFLTDTGTGRAALVVVALTTTVAVGARRCTGAGGTRAIGLVALAALVVPVVLSGHSSDADSHLLAVTALGAHVVAAAVWVGGLLALLVHARRGADLPRAAGRFSGLALACLLVTGSSGVVAAWIVAGGAAGLTTVLGSGYGELLLAKSGAFVVLGLFGWAHRRRTLPRLRAGAPGAFRRFAGVEVLVMLATLAVAVALAASPPPQPAVPAPGTAAATAPAADPMAGHDHGELSVTVLIDDERFHVAGPVAAGSRVTVHNGTAAEATITAADGSFDVVVPGRSLITFLVPAESGSYPFTSRSSPAFADVLVVE
ncbi:copper resistance D family protein [Blastococcus xanthinilyticus]|uniref:Putative copper resistance protein D n=1 Tax=Blastococcus xanthinilyticus TaxID=1564164 RepID=A0A5S5D1G3_9ACTN|nr:CopD family protein [Blastococcus xanthinilyticus]TYP89088.1 putative copper resistance protein D [Blastococcus xanthinilyticus]